MESPSGGSGNAAQRRAAGGMIMPPKGVQGAPPDTPLVTFVVKRKSPGAWGGAPKKVGAGAKSDDLLPEGRQPLLAKEE